MIHAEEDIDPNVQIDIILSEVQVAVREGRHLDAVALIIEARRLMEEVCPRDRPRTH